jgi:hypothetical protein
VESIALQEMVKMVFGDSKTKEEFISNPDIVMSRFSLTEAEKKAVMSAGFKSNLLSDGSIQLDPAIGPLSLWI